MSVAAGRAAGVGLCHRAASFTYFGEVLHCPHKSVKNSDFIDIGNFEVGIRLYSFATDVFTKLGSMLSGTSHHCSVLVALDVSGHDHFGTRHFGTYSIRYIVTSGHVQFRT